MAKAISAGLALVLLAGAALATYAWRLPGNALAFDSEVQLALSAPEVWHKLRDLTLAHHYVPGIERTEIVSQVAEGVGATRRVYSSATDYLVERVESWQPGEGFTLSLVDDNGLAPLPFAQAKFSYQILEGEANSTGLQVRLVATLRGGRLGEWIGKSLLAAPLQARVDAVAEGLKLFYEQ